VPTKTRKPGSSRQKGWAKELDNIAADIAWLLKPWRKVDLIKNPPISMGYQLGVANDTKDAIRTGRMPPSDQILLAVKGLIFPLFVSFFRSDRRSIVDRRKRAREAIKAVARLEDRLSWLGGDEYFDETLYAELAKARRECEEIVKVTKASKAFTKRNCAEIALRLIEEYSTKPVTNGSSDCAYRAITAILYRYSSEAKNEDVDLRYVCTDVLNGWKAERNGQKTSPKIA
jgi:hypothetical protein